VGEPRRQKKKLRKEEVWFLVTGNMPRYFYFAGGRKKIGAKTWAARGGNFVRWEEPVLLGKRRRDLCREGLRVQKGGDLTGGKEDAIGGLRITGGKLGGGRVERNMQAVGLGEREGCRERNSPRGEDNKC